MYVCMYVCVYLCICVDAGMCVAVYLCICVVFVCVCMCVREEGGLSNPCGGNQSENESLWEMVKFRSVVCVCMCVCVCV